jgi:hypothetical protein
MIAEFDFFFFFFFFFFFALLYLIVCNDLAFCFLLLPLVVLSYASFSSYDTRVALDHFASLLCCRTCLNIYFSCSLITRL